MRRLMWFTIGFTAACIVAGYLLAGIWLLLCAAVCIVCMAVLFALRVKPCRIAAVVLLGCAIGFAWNWGFQHYYLQGAMELHGTKTITDFVVTDYSYETEHGVAVDGKVRYKGKTYGSKLYIYDRIDLKPGDRFQGEVTIRYTGKGVKSDPTYHQGKGILLLCYAEEDFTVTGSAGSSLSDFPVRLRQMIAERIDSIFPGDVAGFARALLLGDSSRMTYESSNSFRVSGISHVIAVSGLHVSILFSVIYALCWHRRYLTAVIGIPTLLLFAAVAGLTPSIVRACLMQVLIILSMITDKEYDPPTALAFSVLVLLGINPTTITAVGFQLSVACMIGIYAFSSRIHKYLISRKWAKKATGKDIGSRAIRMAVTSVSVSLSVWIVTTPLCAVHFGMVSIVGILTNLLTVWLISVIFCGIMLSCAVSVLSVPLGCLVAWVIAWLMRFVQMVALLLSKIPYGAVYTSSDHIVMWLIFCYVLLGLFAILRFKRPAAVLLCMLMGLVMACFADAISERWVEQRVTVFDVGQGQCILLKYDDRYYLVDCGGSNAYDAADTAAEFLLSRGIFKLDGLILSHYDSDHAGGAMQLLSRIEADRLYLPEIDPENKTRAALQARYADRITWISDSRQIPEGKLSLFCGNDPASDNESGICVLFQPDNCDILILGDRGRTGELALMKQTDLPDLELLIAGHHGSAGATSYELLLETTPQAVVISVGDNPYGHPSAETLERLKAFDCEVYRTDIHGTIEFGR